MDPASAVAMSEGSGGGGLGVGTAMIGSTALNVAANEWMRGRANDDARKAAQKAWQRTKSGYQHRYRWTMEDMRKAGLNPILAAGSSGFSVQGLSGAQQANMNPPQYQDFSSSAKQMQEAFQTEAEVSKTEEETSYIIKQKLLAIQKAKESIQNIIESKAQTGLAERKADESFTREKGLFRDIAIKEKQVLKLAQELDNLKTMQKEIEARTEYQQQQNEESQSREKEIKQRTENLRITARELSYKLAELARTAEVYEGPAGIWIKSINEIMGALNVHLIR